MSDPTEKSVIITFKYVKKVTEISYLQRYYSQSSVLDQPYQLCYF